MTSGRQPASAIPVNRSAVPAKSGLEGLEDDGARPKTSEGSCHCVAPPSYLLPNFAEIDPVPLLRLNCAQRSSSAKHWVEVNSFYSVSNRAL